MEHTVSHSLSSLAAALIQCASMILAGYVGKLLLDMRSWRGDDRLALSVVTTGAAIICRVCIRVIGVMTVASGGTFLLMLCALEGAASTYTLAQLAPDLVRAFYFQLLVGTIACISLAITEPPMYITARSAATIRLD